MAFEPDLLHGLCRLLQVGPGGGDVACAQGVAACIVVQQAGRKPVAGSFGAGDGLGGAEWHRPGRRRVRPEVSAREDRRACRSNAADHRGTCRTSTGRSPAFRATELGRASRHAGRRKDQTSKSLTPFFPFTWCKAAPAQETTGIPAGAVRIPPEEPGLGAGGQRGESKQVSCLDPRQRLVLGVAHPMPPRAVCAGERIVWVTCGGLVERVVARLSNGQV